MGILVLSHVSRVGWAATREEHRLKQVPDIRAAVASFQRELPRLRYLPLIADAEMEWLYGAEVQATLAELESYNLRQRVCAECAYRCCLRVKCEFYDDRFTRCLVTNYRPALCRLHFCERYGLENAALGRALGDIYLEGLLAVKESVPATALLFDCPAFDWASPAVNNLISPLVEDLRNRKIGEEEAFQMIQHKIEEYFNSPKSD
jgi:hypothetical protein